MMTTIEKSTIAESELAATATGRRNDLLPMDPIERAALERKLVRKLDWTLMPVLLVMIVLK